MKVLLADDEAVSRRLVERLLLRWGYDVIVASDGLEASRLLRQPDAPKLVIFDWMMPGMDGAELCREIRQNRPEPYTYILLLTGKRTIADVIEGLEAGADDYITKPFEPQELKVRLRAGKRIICLQDQLIAARETMRDMASHDSLTGLWNRAAVLETLTAEVNRARRQQSSLGVIMADLDHFKQINDTYGHPAGDATLREAARVMRATTRPYDAVGRFGGEEFLIVLPGCDKINTTSHAERLRAAIGQIRVNAETRLTVSLGVSVFGLKSDLDVQGLVNAADGALYEAKRAGRDRVECAPTADALAMAH